MLPNTKVPGKLYLPKDQQALQLREPADSLFSVYRELRPTGRSTRTKPQLSVNGRYRSLETREISEMEVRCLSCVVPMVFQAALITLSLIHI